MIPYIIENPGRTIDTDHHESAELEITRNERNYERTSTAIALLYTTANEHRNIGQQYGHTMIDPNISQDKSLGEPEGNNFPIVPYESWLIGKYNN